MKNLYVFAIACVLMLAMFLTGRYMRPRVVPAPTVITRVDTLRDTVLVPVTRYVTRTETVRLPAVETVRTDTLYLWDTVTVEVPIERVEYRTPEYHAVIEGFHPRLAAMEVYAKTTIETSIIKKRPQFGVGLQFGYGYAYKYGRVPYIGIGVQYNLFTF